MTSNHITINMGAKYKNKNKITSQLKLRSYITLYNTY